MLRRNFFKKSTLAGLGILGTNMLPAHIADSAFHFAPKNYKLIVPSIWAPQGAVYIPAKAYNTYQQWRDYDQQETERDFGYAANLGLNSLRIWLSYDYWLEDPDRHESRLQNMLQAAHTKGLKILLALFDTVGVENTKQAREDLSPDTGVGVRTPATAICIDEKRWKEPAKFVKRIMSLFGNDKRLLAIEIMNEPGFADKRLALCRYLFKIAKDKQGTIPLTVGSLQEVQNWGHFMDLGIDILQVHLNFPTSVEEFNKSLTMSKQAEELLKRPFWITEWQRIRPGGSGLTDVAIPEEVRWPNLSGLAPSIMQSGLGNYFWSLMLKPAYLPHQRSLGTVNGLFHEDGAVYSLADAKSVSHNPTFMAIERKEKPGWLK